MDYTKNYHLPQWVKSDRIMMDDFNRMCADIENGLTGNRTEFRQNNSDLSGQIQRVEREAKEQIRTSDTASQSSLKSGLLRLAYNHCHLLAAVEKQPPQNGCFFQRFKGMSVPAEASGLLARGDALWIARGAAAYSSEDFRSQLQQVSPMQVTKGNAAANRPMILRFTPPGPGCIKEFPLKSSLDNIAKHTSTLHFALYNEHTGEYEAEMDYNWNLGSYSGRTSFETLRINLYFSGGFTYRMEVSTTDSHYNGTATYLSSKESTFERFSAESYTADTTGVLTHTVQCGEARLDGIVLVHYRMIGTGGSLSLAWDGAAIPPSRTGNITTIDGNTVAEMEFRRNAAVPTATSIQLRARCNSGGEIALYSWGTAAV